MELKLLLGKVYSQWKGHDSQALAAYEAIIRDDPDDFRCAWGLVRTPARRFCGSIREHYASALLIVTGLLKTPAQLLLTLGALISELSLHGS